MSDNPITWTQLKQEAKTFTEDKVYRYKLKTCLSPSLVAELTRQIRNRLKKDPVVYYTKFACDIRIET